MSGWLWSRSVIDRDEDDRDLTSLTVPRVGCLAETGDVWEPWRLLDPAGEVVEPVAAWLRDLQAAGRSALTQRSYGMDLLRWFRPDLAQRQPAPCAQRPAQPRGNAQPTGMPGR